jgi:hypothetical protein
MGIVVIRQLSKLLKSMFLHKEVTFSKDFQRQKSNHVRITEVVWKSESKNT